MAEQSEVHIWQRRLDPNSENAGAAEATLSAEEKQRADRFRFPNDRLRFILRHAFLREVVATYLELPPDDVPLETRLNERPQLVGRASAADLRLSLSSSEDQAVVGVAWQRRVGVDIERARSDVDDAGIARRFFSPAEYADLQAAPPSRRQTVFFRIWARKEAYVKAIGLGLSRDLSSFDVSPSDQGAATNDEILVNDREALEGASRWLVKDVPAPAGFASACCAEGEDWSIVHRVP